MRCVVLDWEETGEPGENTDMHEENMHTPHRKNTAGISAEVLSAGGIIGEDLLKDEDFRNCLC